MILLSCCLIMALSSSAALDLDCIATSLVRMTESSFLCGGNCMLEGLCRCGVHGRFKESESTKAICSDGPKVINLW